MSTGLIRWPHLMETRFSALMLEWRFQTLHAWQRVIGVMNPNPVCSLIWSRIWYWSRDRLKIRKWSHWLVPGCHTFLRANILSWQSGSQVGYYGNLRQAWVRLAEISFGALYSPLAVVDSSLREENSRTCVRVQLFPKSADAESDMFH